MKYIGIVLLIIFLGGALFFFKNRGLLFQNGLDLKPGELVQVSDLPISTPKGQKEVPYKVEEYVSNLKVPWSLVFTDNSRILVTEREGALRQIVNGVLNEKPLLVFPETSHTGEEGLLGITQDPDYSSNKYLYVIVAYGKNKAIYEKVVRLKDQGDTITIDKTIFDNIPAAVFHDGGTLKFGPDGKLYISTGDALKKENAQNLSSLSGKILRINPDGTIPSDNPFPNSPIWSYGHRNPQGFDWYPDSKIMYETEHGPSVVDGPAGGDEVNIIDISENYGWPIAHHEIHKDGMQDPKIVFTPAFAPASGMFYKSKVFPQFYGNFFFGGLKGEGIMRVIVDPKSPTTVVSYGKLDGINFGRIRDIKTGTDGYIYFTTSNRDGRGSPKTGDDKIYRIVPANKK